MGYYEFTIRIPAPSRDALFNRLSELGCLGITDHGDKVIAYFKDGIDIAGLRDEIGSFRQVLRDAGLDPDFSFDYFYLSERDWNEPWKKRFIPIDVGEHFSILPPWASPDPTRIPLIIDPGMAFGTGHHETTGACLSLIEKYSTAALPPREGVTPPSPPLNLRGGGVGSQSFLDVGTGTGILAIAASRLGFGHVVGVDIDPLAVDAAKRNAERNQLTDITIVEGRIDSVEGSFSMIAANLMSEILIRIAGGIAAHLKRHGVAILSGMLVGQEDDVLKAMLKAGLEEVERRYDGRWVSAVVSH